MSVRVSEPHGTVDSMEELFAVAAEMERAAIDGYSGLAGRMRREGRSDLAAVFDRLVAGKKVHLAHLDRRSSTVTGKPSDRSALKWEPEPSFDDEGAGAAAPELLSAYRAFAIAVRNEERAFAFWSYLAARARTDALRAACEQMAREELAHVAALRRERRSAFHAERGLRASGGGGWTMLALERRLAELLDAAGGMLRYADEARRRAEALLAAPLNDSALLAQAPAGAGDRASPCAELLLECYLDLAERLPSQEDRDRTQTFAAQLLDCLQAIRSGPAADG